MIPFLTLFGVRIIIQLLVKTKGNTTSHTNRSDPTVRNGLRSFVLVFERYTKIRDEITPSSACDISHVLTTYIRRKLGGGTPLSKILAETGRIGQRRSMDLADPCRVG